MEITIREATINDHQGLCELYAELDELHRLNHPELFIKPEEYARAKEYILESINDPNKVLLVAEGDAAGVVGYAECNIQLSANFPVIKKRAWVQLDGIAVKRKYQHLRIGSMLLKRVVEWAGSKGLDRIELKVYTFNSEAEDFYSKKGFKELSKAMYLDL